MYTANQSRSGITCRACEWAGPSDFTPRFQTLWSVNRGKTCRGTAGHSTNLFEKTATSFTLYAKWAWGMRELRNPFSLSGRSFWKIGLSSLTFLARNFANQWLIKLAHKIARFQTTRENGSFDTSRVLGVNNSKNVVSWRLWKHSPDFENRLRFC